MKIVDGRGKNRSNIGKKNRESIVEFFKNNPDKTKTDCARELGVSYKTVLRHVELMMEGK